jgi:hypothetical protein
MGLLRKQPRSIPAAEGPQLPHVEMKAYGFGAWFGIVAVAVYRFPAVFRPALVAAGS